jgi:monoamine oxidase
MLTDDSLRGVSVLIAGAGLSGLTAARELQRCRAEVVIVEARDRLGGRVWTWRDGFAEEQHAEAGGDLIEESQTEILRLAEELGVRPVRILRRGFSGFHSGVAPAHRGAALGWEGVERALEDLIRAYRLAERRWDSPISEALAGISVAGWLDRINATAEMRSTALGMRGFFLADPEDLSLLALVDQFADEETPGQARMYRIDGGNDSLVTALAKPLADRIRLQTALVSVAHSADGVDATVRASDGLLSPLHADYLICSLPAAALKMVRIEPPLPSFQVEAIEHLPYGPATRTTLQFEQPTWRTPGKPRAYGTDLPIGAVWDGNEEQNGTPGILTLLAGGSASRATRELLARGGIAEIVKQLDWLSVGRTRLVTHRVFSWEEDPWAGGGYAYFSPRYDPSWRAWLARPTGRLLFAGEHTSFRWQGYMNGAVESGLRAAAEVLAKHRQLP